MHLNNDSKSLRRTPNDWRIDVGHGQSACDNKWIFSDAVSAPRLHGVWPRRPSLSPIGRNMIGLVSRFGSIIVKCQSISVYRFRPWVFRAFKLRDLNPVDTSWSRFNYCMAPNFRGAQFLRIVFQPRKLCSVKLCGRDLLYVRS